MKLKVTVTKTSSGGQDYIQIMSDDMLSVNVVLVAEQIQIDDLRRKPVKR
jgi:hypothetical protein